jgi:NAD(P)-dependent dehydrogenase (short-subunit alcohol dehydrogenase family)
MNCEELAGGVAVITGAGSGIGAGLVTVAAEIGMSVALADVDLPSISMRATELSEQGVDAFAMYADVRSSADLIALADAVYERWGRTTLLINNAGVELHGNVWEVSPDQWRNVVDINLNGVFNGINAFVPRMIAEPSPSHVATIASVAALRTNPGTSAYAATKHGSLAMTECLALELAGIAPQIKVTAVLPGAVRSKIAECAVVAETEGGIASHQKLTRSIMTRGLDPVVAARIMLTGIAEGKLRVHTDPDQSREFIRDRYESLNAL